MYTQQIAAKEFLHHCMYEKNLSSKTIKSYQIDLKQFYQFLLNKNYSNEVARITKIEIRDYLESLSKLKPKSIKRKIATLKAMMNYLEYEDKIDFNPIRKMKIRIKEPKTLPRFLSIEEIIRIFKSAYKEIALLNKDSYSYQIMLRNIAVIELLFATGARVSEIANLKNDDIDIITGTVTINGKGNKERIIQICSEETLKLLFLYKNILNKNIIQSCNFFLINRINKGLSDQSIRNIVKIISKRANIQNHVTPHIFRHTFATLLLEKGVDIKYIQSFLGHSSITTTQIYTHVNREKQRQILSSKHPRKDFSEIHI